MITVHIGAHPTVSMLLQNKPTKCLLSGKAFLGGSRASRQYFLECISVEEEESTVGVLSPLFRVSFLTL
jgi:hypothetical protein